MSGELKDTRKTFSVMVGKFQHTLIEQSRYNERTNDQKGAYMGYTGFVLKSVTKIL